MYSNFAKYLANQIRMGNLDRDEVLKTYPDIANEIEEALTDFDVVNK